METLTNPHANQQVENIIIGCDLEFSLKQIDINEIKKLKHFQVREVIDPVGVFEGEFSKIISDEYIESVKRGDAFPAIVVRQNDNGYDMVDGRHRFYAYKTNGINLIWAYVLPGYASNESCRNLACILNDIHGHANSAGDKKKVSLENATNAYFQSLEISSRDPSKLFAEIAKDYRVNEATLRSRVKSRQAKDVIFQAGGNPNAITDTIARDIHSIITELPNETIKKIVETIDEAKKNGVLGERISAEIMEAKSRNKTAEQLIKKFQQIGDLDDNNRKMRAGDAAVSRMTDMLIANLEAAKQSLKRDISSYRLDHEKIKQVLCCLKEIKSNSAVWELRIGG